MRNYIRILISLLSILTSVGYCILVFFSYMVVVQLETSPRDDMAKFFTPAGIALSFALPTTVATLVAVIADWKHARVVGILALLAAAAVAISLFLYW